MTAEPKMPILVGVDGTEQSLVAAQWAVADGDLRSASVRLVAVVDDASRDDAAFELLSRVTEQCRSDRPRVEVFNEIKHGMPIENLMWASSEAQLLVVGSRGRGQIAEAVLGSVSTAAAMHARCPVVVVRDRQTSFAVGPVVVGVDDSAPARAALRFAFEEAAARKTDLLAMHIWSPVLAEYSWIEPSPAGASWFSLDDAHRKLGEQLAPWREEYPGVEVRDSVRYGHPVEELTMAASHGQLLVVGHRGIGGFKELILGSVAHGVLHHAECPVAIVRSGLTP